MPERLVTHAFRDSNGVIHAVGNPASDWFRRRREWAIGDIVAGRHSYVVQSGQGTRPLRVVNGPSGPYSRTDPDSSADNNLDNLPEFDLDPWEVAHDDAEVLAVHVALVIGGLQGQVLIFGGTGDSGDGGWIVTITPGLDTKHRPR